MAEKAEVKQAPKAPAKAVANGLNKDGFVAGASISDEDYHRHMAELRQKAKK